MNLRNDHEQKDVSEVWGIAELASISIDMYIFWGFKGKKKTSTVACYF